MPCQVRQNARFDEEWAYWSQSSQPCGDGHWLQQIFSRSLGIVANGPKSLLIREAWELMKSAIYSPICIIPGHRRLHGLTVARYLLHCSWALGAILAHGACWLWAPRGWWALASCWATLWSARSSTDLSSKSSVSAWSMLPATVRLVLPGLDFPTAGKRWMRCKSDVADLQTHCSEEKFSGTAGTNRL